MIQTQPVRRLATAIGVIAVLVLGFGSIRAAAAWSAASAPLSVSPDSVASLQSQLVNEQNRTGALQVQLRAIEAQSTDLVSALDAARARIGTDASRAQEMAQQLKTAKLRLANLQATIASASLASSARATSTTTVQSAMPQPTSGGEAGEAGWGGDD